MSDKDLLSEAAFELRNYEFTELAEAVQRAADAADDTHVRVPRQVAVDLYKMGGFLAEYEVYKGLKEPVQELGKALFDVKA